MTNSTITPFMNVHEAENENYRQGRIRFPGWRQLTDHINDQFEEQVGETHYSIQVATHQYLKTIDKVRKKLSSSGEHLLPELAHQFVKNARGRYQKGSDMNSVMTALRSIDLGSTEFFSIYDVLQNEHIKVDDRVEDILGIPKEKFNIRSLSGYDSSWPLHHPDDIHHFVRLATIAYMITCLPGFNWKANQDYFRANLRLGTSMSHIAALREARYVMAELKIYMSHEIIDGEDFLPILHLDRWTIYDASEFNGIKPYFSSGLTQSAYMNAYLYLFHAYLLDISPKYILMMHERAKHDRYKAIAKSLNDQVKHFTGRDLGFEESQVANYFSKTIRQKMGNLELVWDRKKELVVPEGDLQTVDIARRLGLLPIPPLVLESIFKHIDPNH